MAQSRFSSPDSGAIMGSLNDGLQAAHQGSQRDCFASRWRSHAHPPGALNHLQAFAATDVPHPHGRVRILGPADDPTPQG